MDSLPVNDIGTSCESKHSWLSSDMDRISKESCSARQFNRSPSALESFSAIYVMKRILHRTNSR